MKKGFLGIGSILLSLAMLFFKPNCIRIYGVDHQSSRGI